MVVGYAHKSFSKIALQNFNQMQLSGVKSNYEIFAIILPIYSTMKHSLIDCNDNRICINHVVTSQHTTNLNIKLIK